MKTSWFFLASIMIFPTPNISAQWVQSNYPSKASIYSLVVSPQETNIFAGTHDSGIFLSSNGGANWTSVTNPLPPYTNPSTGLVTYPQVELLAFADTNLFAGIGARLYLSTNNGMNWTSVDSGLPSVHAFASCGSNVFVGTGGQGVFLSTNNGASWIAVNTGLPQYQDQSWTYYFAVNELVIFDTIIFAGTDDGVFSSTNSGTSWTALNTGLPRWPDDSTNFIPVRHFAVDTDSDGTTLFAATYPGALYRLAKDRSSWIAVNSGFASAEIMSFVASGSNLYAGILNAGVILSTDGGASWKPANEGIPKLQITPGYSKYPDINCFAVSGQKIFAGTSGCRVYLSANSDTSWTAVSTGLRPSPYVMSIAASPQGSSSYSLWAHGLVSTDRGSSWTPTGGGTGPVAFSGTNIISGSYFSTDNGHSWTAATLHQSPDEIFSPISIAVGESTLFAGTWYDWGVGRSLDHGASWEKANAGLPYIIDEGGAISYRVTCVGLLGQVVFAGPAWWGIYRSTDYGEQWMATNTGLPVSLGHDSRTLYPMIFSFAASGTNLFVATSPDYYEETLRRYAEGAIYISRDSGAVWIKTGFPSRPRALSLTVIGSNLLAGTDSGGVYRSTDDGATWTTVSEGLPATVAVTAFCIGGHDLYIGTADDGVWRRPLSEIITGIEAERRLPEDFRLEQNYPNPFNPTTTIKFELTNVSHVSLTVYDILGREISVLVKERKNAGSYEVKFDASGLASGVYFYRLQAGSFVDTKKLLLVK